MDLYLDEEFREIKEAPHYIITNYGRVFNTITDKQLNLFQTKGQSKKLNYLEVHLCINGKKKRYKIHRLVAEYFILFSGYNPDGTDIKGKIEVNHKDHNVSNNHYSNLEWCDRTYNNRHKTNNKYVYLSIDDLILLRKTYKYGSSEYWAITSTIYDRRKHEVC